MYLTNAPRCHQRASPVDMWRALSKEMRRQNCCLGVNVPFVQMLTVKSKCQAHLKLTNKPAARTHTHTKHKYCLQITVCRSLVTQWKHEIRSHSHVHSVWKVRGVSEIITSEHWTLTLESFGVKNLLAYTADKDQNKRKRRTASDLMWMWFSKRDPTPPRGFQGIPSKTGSHLFPL